VWFQRWEKSAGSTPPGVSQVLERALRGELELGQFDRIKGLFL
jgi:hypothetical protein